MVESIILPGSPANCAKSSTLGSKAKVLSSILAHKAMASSRINVEDI